MKRTLQQILALVLALSLALSLSGCSLFDTKMVRAVQKMSTLESVTIDLEAQVLLDLRAGEQTMPLDAGLSGEVTLFPDPLLAKGDFTLKLPGGKETAVAYLEKQEGVFYLYSRANAGTLWNKMGFMEMKSSASKKGVWRYIAESAESFERMGLEELYGETAARYDGVISGEFIRALAERLELESTLRDGYGVQLAEGFFNEVPDVPAHLWLSEEDSVILALELELTEAVDALAKKQLRDFHEETDWDALDLELSLAEATLFLRLSEYNKAEKFTIPDEATAAWGEIKQPWEV